MPARGKVHTLLPICQGCAFDGRSEDIRGRKFLLFYFTPPLLRLLSASSLYYPIFFAVVYLLKRTGAPDLYTARSFDPCTVVKYVYNTCAMGSENSAQCTCTERTDCCVHPSHKFLVRRMLAQYSSYGNC